MTSINAIRFDDQSGAMICDESRHWNAERAKMLVADKIRPVVSDKVAAACQLAAAYGNTGTSTVGEELRVRIRERVDSEFDKAVEAAGGIPSEFLSMDELAELVFEEQCALKERHIDQQLRGRYGFRTRDLVRGWYEGAGGKVEISEKTVAEAADILATWRDRKGDARAVFGNNGIVGGWSARDGFRIYQFSMNDGTFGPVQEMFIARGSGCDMADVEFSRFAASQAPEGGGSVDPVDGLTAAISAVNAAMKSNLGVGGYPGIILFDGRSRSVEGRMKLFQDHRSKLGCEIVTAAGMGMLNARDARALVSGLFFEGWGFEKALDAFHSVVRSRDALSRALRGYSR